MQILRVLRINIASIRQRADFPDQQCCVSHLDEALEMVDEAIKQRAEELNKE